jgi:hypothetical protein
MRWTTQAAACLVAMALAGCGPRDGTRDTGAAPGAGTGTETGTMSDTSAVPGNPDMTRDTTGMGGMTADTGQQGISSDTARTGNRMRSDSGQHNQTESGVTDSSGTSTLGKDAAKTRPDQSQPVTSKGDTINPGVDSAR